jgi:hypothetical protein
VTAYTVATKIRGFAVDVTLDKATELWRFPLEPVTISESGFEKIHQGAVFLHNWRLNLEPGETWQGKLHFALRDIEGLV